MVRPLRAHLALLIGSGLLATAGCTPTDQSDPAPSEAQPATADPDSGPGWPTITEVDPSGVPGLSTYTVSDNARQLHVVVPQLQSHQRVNAHLHEIADDEAASYLADTVAPRQEDGELTTWQSSTWAAAAVSADILGLTLTTSYSPGASTGTTQQVIWYDPLAGEVLDWQDLLTDEALPLVVDAVVEDLDAGEVVVDSEAVRQYLAEGDPAVGFTDKGALFVGFDSHTVAPGAAGTPAVALDDPDGQGWLSDVGEVALEASLHPDSGAVPTAPEVSSRAPVDCAQERCVALTFDDGPSPATTPELLDILAAEQVPATFFVLGSQAQAFPELVAREVADGHEIGNHTWTHPDLSALSGEAVRDEVTRNNDVVADITGVQPRLLRPPYGATHQPVADVAASLDMAQVMWDIDTVDWEHHDPAQTVARADEAERGSIVLMHDVHATTVDAVPEVITRLRGAGFTFVTVSELLGQVTPGETYARGD